MLGRRRWLGAAGALIGAVTIAGVGTPLAAAPSPPVQVLVIDGRGFGHGVGMAQDGALAMGRAGSSTEQILGQFYPGTTLGSVGQDSPLVRVSVFNAGAPPTGTVVSFPEGGVVLDSLGGAQSPGFPVGVAPGGSVTLQWDGNVYRVSPAGGVRAAGASTLAAAGPPTTLPVPAVPTTVAPTTTTTTPRPRTTTTPTTAAPRPTPSAPSSTSPARPAAPSAPPAGTATSSRPLWAVPASGGHPGQGTTTVIARGRTYRGAVQAEGENGSLLLVDQVVVEDYLKGMGEVLDPSWPSASLRTQAIAARTYALRAMHTAGELCDDERCQVYLGAQVEYGAMSQAVDATRGQVLVAGGTFAATVYSANGGGFEASRIEGFGVDDAAEYPYLRPARYLTNDPSPWETKVALTDVAHLLNYGGTLSAVGVIGRGASGRVLQLALDGSAGRMMVSGLDAASSLGLKSTLFDTRTELDASALVPPPPVPAPLQLPPDQIKGVVPMPTTDVPTAPVPALSGGAALGHRIVTGGAGVPWWASATAILLLVMVSLGLVTSSPAGRPRPTSWPDARRRADGSP